MKKIKELCIVLIIAFITIEGISFFILQKKIDMFLLTSEDLKHQNENILTSLKFIQSKQLVIQKNITLIPGLLSNQEEKIVEKILIVENTVLKLERQYFNRIKKFKIEIVSSLDQINADVHFNGKIHREDWKIAESDSTINKLLQKGKMLYEKKEFTEAKPEYKKILTLNPGQKEALIYYNASLYYLNPGDESTFPGIKKRLVPLIEEKDLGGEGKRTVFTVLLGISREDGDRASEKKYEAALKHLEAVK